jgi:hypothetical protein
MGIQTLSAKEAEDKGGHESPKLSELEFIFVNTLAFDTEEIHIRYKDVMSPAYSLKALKKLT